MKYDYLFSFVIRKRNRAPQIGTNTTQNQGTLVTHTKHISSPEGNLKRLCIKELIIASLNLEQFKCDPARNVCWKPPVD